MRPIKRFLPLGLVILALAAACAGGWYWTRAKPGAGEVRYRTAKVQRGPIAALASASGTLNAVSIVQVAPPIPGQVKDILADFNTPVKKDQVLARLDAAAFELRASQARADVDAARSALGLSRANAAAAEAEAARLRAAERDAERELGRKKPLAEKSFISPAEWDRTKAALGAARDNAKAAEAQLNGAHARLAAAATHIKQREALASQAQAELERTVIRAPVDGTVILRNVEAGQSVAPGRQAAALFTIAQDLHMMQLDAAMSTADAAHLREGQQASFAVDALPRRRFTGTVREIRRSAATEEASGYTVVIAVPNPDLALLPGMAAKVSITLDSRASALKLPNAALRFRPASDPDGGRVWMFLEGELVPVEVRLGISDGAFTEIVAGPLAAGDEVVVGAAQAAQ
ncbi:MAG TPA: efflux RND transporter periplasmic adaptor subunit [Burkholderiales bacterium]|jgi:HlyD family secretion protein